MFAFSGQSDERKLKEERTGSDLERAESRGGQTSPRLFFTTSRFLELDAHLMGASG